MGFSSFSSSKNKKHESVEFAYKESKHKRNYRQYMNRKGGFNKKLNKMD